MPYYIINKYPVFLSWARYEQLRNEVLKDKDPIYVTASRIAGYKEAKEVEQLIYEILNVKYNKDPENFYTDWARFDMVDEEARQNVWDLLYDYCTYYGYAYLKDLRDIGKIIIDDYEDNSLIYPMGRIFAFNHFVKPTKWWWKFTHNMKGRTIRLLIVTENVTRLVGVLSNFAMWTKDFIAICRDNLDILPIPK